MKKLYGLCLHKSCDLFYGESFFYVGKLKLFIWKSYLGSHFSPTRFLLVKPAEMQILTRNLG